MDWRAYARQQLTDITGDPARDAEITEEIAQYLASRFDEMCSAGVSETEALNRVVDELRNSAQLAHLIRHAERVRPAAPRPPAHDRPQLLTDLSKDVRYAVRLLRRTPGFTSAALFTLALGIGMTTAIFSVVQAVLLRPVPFPEPERLVMMWETDRNSGTTREPASFPDFIDYRDRSRQVDRVGAFTPLEMDVVSGHGDPRRVSALGATPELLQLLGVTPIAGRSFTADEDRPASPPVVMISDRLWEQLFGRDPAAINGVVHINGTQARIVGVVSSSAGFGVLQMLSAAAYARGFADRDPRTLVDVWTTLRADPKTDRGSNHSFLMVGRLAAGATVGSARDEMTAIAADLERSYPDDNAGRGAFLETLDDVVFGRTRTALTILLLAVSLVLLISCVNVAHLLLARATSRVREVAVRAALGAELPRLARQFVVENIVLALLAAALSVPLAYGVLRVLMIVGPATIPRLATVSLNENMLFLALGLSAVIGLVFGALPVVQARRTDLLTALKADVGRGATSGREGRIVRSALVVGEVALAVLLVSGAGLLIRSFWNLSRTDPGFDVTGVLKAEFQISRARYPTGREAEPHFVAYNTFVQRLLERVRSLPGVESAALAAHHPLDTGYTQSFFVVGREAEAENWPELSVRHVTPQYFQTLRVPLIRGRFLTDADTSTSERVITINQATADRFFPNQDPLGQKIGFWGVQWTIVGIVGNEHFHGVAKPAPIGAYAPLTRTRFTTLVLAVRTADPVDLAPAVRAAIRDVDSDLAVFGLEPLEDTLANTLAEQRFMMLLLGLFAAVAVALAAIGIHGVLTYLVAQRTREIGVRMALGAGPAHVTGMVVRQGMRLVGLGLAAGVALALTFSGSLSGLLFGVTPQDPGTLISVIIVLALVAIVSIWLPTRRAVRVDPLTALRQE